MTYDLKAVMAGVDSARRYMNEHGVKSSFLNALVVDCALSRGLTVGSDRRGRVILRDGRSTHWYSRGSSSLNDDMARKCVRYKNVASALLRSRGVSAPENGLFGPSEEKRAWMWAESLLPVVLKPSNAKGGAMVYVGVTDAKEFNLAFAAIAKAYGRVLVEQYVEGVEHRVLIANYRVVAVTRRVPAHIVGDGYSAVESLVEAKSSQRLATMDPIHKSLPLDDLAVRELERQDLTVSSVPSEGRVVYLRSTSNLHFGGDAIDATDDITAAEVSFAEHAARALRGLRFGGFDLVLPRDGSGGRPAVLEVNAGPVISMHHFPAKGVPRDAAGALLDTMFPRTAR